MRYDKERRFPGQDAMSKCLTISTSHSVLVTGSEIQTTSAPRVMMPVPGLIHERSDKCRLEDDQVGFRTSVKYHGSVAVC